MKLGRCQGTVWSRLTVGLLRIRGISLVLGLDASCVWIGAGRPECTLARWGVGYCAMAVLGSVLNPVCSLSSQNNSISPSDSLRTASEKHRSSSDYNMDSNKKRKVEEKDSMSRYVRLHQRSGHERALRPGGEV